MLESGLVVPGTLVGYDDWWTYLCAAHGGGRGLGTAASRASSAQLDAALSADVGGGERVRLLGEWRAHVELAREFNVSFACVAGPCRMPPAGFERCSLYNHVAPIFLVRSLGEGSVADDGLGELSPAELRAFLTSWPVCGDFARRHTISGV